MGLFNAGTSQKVSNGSTAIQAQGDVTITNGLSAQDVKVIFELLFENQFPKIQEIARQQAILNGNEFQAKVISDLHKNSKRIITDKFKDPDVQALLNDALISASRKGEKSHPELLSKLIVEKVSSGNSDLKDIVISEAIDVIPKLTKQQIALMCGVFILKDMQISSPLGEVIYLLSRFHDKFEKAFGLDFNLSNTNLNHISYTGACNYNDFMGIDAIDAYLGKYNNFGAANKIEAQAKVKAVAPSIHNFLEKINTPTIGGITLTSVGLAIAITAINEIQQIEYSNWIR